VVKQKGMVFGFRKKATAVVGPEIDRPIRYEAQIQFWLNSENTRLQSNNSCYVMHLLCLKLAWYRNHVLERRLLFPHDSHQDFYCRTCIAGFQLHGV
jgi:hypothetical protein